MKASFWSGQVCCSSSHTCSLSATSVFFTAKLLVCRLLHVPLSVLGELLHSSQQKCLYVGCYMYLVQIWVNLSQECHRLDVTDQELLQQNAPLAVSNVICFRPCICCTFCVPHEPGDDANTSHTVRSSPETAAATS